MLEVGCGNGKLWQESLARVPTGWNVVLTDRSAGMLGEARRVLGHDRRRFRFAVADIRDIPFEDQTFDGIIANHMLYHVPQRNQALAEVRRALKRGGRFFATANGEAHLGRLKALMNEFAPPDGRNDAFGVPLNTFTLDGGVEELRRHFSDVTTQRLRGELAVTDVEAVVDYILSMERAREIIAGEPLVELRKRIVDEIETHGAFMVATEIGILRGTR